MSDAWVTWLCATAKVSNVLSFRLRWMTVSKNVCRRRQNGRNVATAPRPCRSASEKIIFISFSRRRNVFSERLLSRTAGDKVPHQLLGQIRPTPGRVGPTPTVIIEQVCRRTVNIMTVLISIQPRFKKGFILNCIICNLQHVWTFNFPAPLKMA